MAPNFVKYLHVYKRSLENETRTGIESDTTDASSLLASKESKSSVIGDLVTPAGTLAHMESMGEDFVHAVSEKTKVPVWGVLLVILVIFGVIVVIFYCCLQRWWRKFRGDKGKGLIAGKVDIRSVQLLGQTYKEKVQPDTEELTMNMEEQADDKESTKSDVKLGRLQFKIDYDFNQCNLAITVIQAEDLPGLDMSGTSDPYVKHLLTNYQNGIQVYLMPDKKKKFETKVHRKTLNPVFNETFNFKVTYSEITTKTLVFAVYDFD
ncbi:synaptotagmin 1-like protein, partial [Leptotrombidium deliense]